jgi:hypothetical protein
MDHDNVPVVIQQMFSNAMDQTTPKHIRYNYIVSMRAVIKYCERAIASYEKSLIAPPEKKK